MHSTRGAYDQMQVSQLLKMGSRQRDGRNRFGDRDMPGDFMRYCADVLIKLH